MQQVVTGELRVFGELVDQPETGLRAVAHRDGCRPVERDDGRRPQREEPVVQRHDLRPVGVVRGVRLGMHGRDRGLDLIRPRRAEGERATEQRQPLLDLRAIPEPPILIGEEHHLSAVIHPGPPARVVQEHQ
jgi:hypothetical protein